MGLKKIIRLFESGNVCVYGVMGSGKDVLTGNVIMRRERCYISNMDYGGYRIPFDFNDLSFGGNTYKDFISGDVKYFEWPHPDKIDVYLSDAGIYLPAQYCNELNKAYPYLPVAFALTRQCFDGRFHVNSQALQRTWDKFRESSDIYLRCCWVIKPLIKHFGIVVQRVIQYERYESAKNKVPPFPLRRPLMNKDRQLQYDLAYTNYLIAHGEIKSHILIYKNRSRHNTRYFKELLLNGKKRT